MPLFLFVKYLLVENSEKPVENYAIFVEKYVENPVENRARGAKISHSPKQG